MKEKVKIIKKEISYLWNNAGADGLMPSSIFWNPENFVLPSFKGHQSMGGNLKIRVYFEP